MGITPEMLDAVRHTARDTIPDAVRQLYVEDAARFGVGFSELRSWNQDFCLVMAARLRWVDCLLRDCIEEECRRYFGKVDWWVGMAPSSAHGMPDSDSDPAQGHSHGLRSDVRTPRQAAAHVDLPYITGLIGSPDHFKHLRLPLRAALPAFVGGRRELHSLFVQFVEIRRLVCDDEPVYQRDLELDLAVAEKLALAVSRDAANDIRGLTPVAQVLVNHPGRVAAQAAA